jgi:hypothetical protein
MYAQKNEKKYNKKSRIRTGVKKNERFSTDMILKKKVIFSRLFLNGNKLKGNKQKCNLPII